MDLTDLTNRGWVGPFEDADLAQWAKAATATALQTAHDPGQRAAWLRHGGTWYAGVNALPNDGAGAVAGAGPLRGATVDALSQMYGPVTWDRAQISAVYPGYPRQDPDESDAAHRFRQTRDAAHVDGLLPVGPNKRRFLKEPHGFVLGLPVTDCSADASPMVVWDGSHTVMRRAFQAAFADRAPDTWDQVDVTEIYAAARKQCFDTCRRVIVAARPGQAYLVHRMALHGVAPWGPRATAPDDGRVILYFRPDMPGGMARWLSAP